MAHYGECAQASGARRPTKAKLDSDNRSAPPRITDHEQSYTIDKKTEQQDKLHRRCRVNLGKLILAIHI